MDYFEVRNEEIAEKYNEIVDQIKKVQKKIRMDPESELLAIGEIRVNKANEIVFKTRKELEKRNFKIFNEFFKDLGELNNKIDTFLSFNDSILERAGLKEGKGNTRIDSSNKSLEELHEIIKVVKDQEKEEIMSYDDLEQIMRFNVVEGKGDVLKLVPVTTMVLVL